MRHGDVSRIMTVTRHKSVRSFKVYCDVQAVSAGQLAQKLNVFLPTAVAAQEKLFGDLAVAYQSDAWSAAMLLLSSTVPK